MSITIKLKKLLEKARAEGTTPEEAATFMAKVNELLAKHEISMSEVEYAKIPEVDPMGQGGAVDPLKKRKREAWSEALAGAVARAHYCKIVLTGWGSGVYFVGRKLHRESAEITFTHLAGEVERLCHSGYQAAMKRGEHRGFAEAFRRGFVNAIETRVREMRRAQEREAAANTSGTALIRLQSMENAVTTYMATNMKLRSAGRVNGRSTGNARGREQGYAAGRNANLNVTGLGRAGSSKLLGE